MGEGQSTFALADKKVVIVGGGFAGGHAAHSLKGHCQLTLIDPREYFHFCVGSLRACTDPGFEKKIMIPYEPYLGDSFKQGKVTSLTPERKVVILDSGEEVFYDYLIIATGSSGPFPGKLNLDKNYSSAESDFKDMQEKIKTAAKIVLIGGGAVGSELAGEISTDCREKEVTLVHGGSELIGGPFKTSLKDDVLKQLKDKGVNVVLGEKVVNLDELTFDGFKQCVVKTNKGTEIEADLVIMCTGMSVNAEAFKDVLAATVDEKNHLKVNQYLQVEGHDDIFAIGDCCNMDKLKMAFIAEDHAHAAAKNIEAHANGGSMTPYSPRSGVPIIGVSIGRDGGSLQIAGVVFGSFITKNLKSKTMFHEKGWKMLGQTPPK